MIEHQFNLALQLIDNQCYLTYKNNSTSPVNFMAMFPVFYI